MYTNNIERFELTIKNDSVHFVYSKPFGGPGYPIDGICIYTDSSIMCKFNSGAQRKYLESLISNDFLSYRLLVGERFFLVNNYIVFPVHENGYKGSMNSTRKFSEVYFVEEEASMTGSKFTFFNNGKYEIAE